MRRVITPHVKVMADTFGVHDLGNAFGLVNAIAFPRTLTDDECNLNSANRLKRIVIREIRQIIHRIVEIETLVVVTFKPVANIVISGQAEHMTEIPRIFQREVQRVVSSEARTRCGNANIL